MAVCTRSSDGQIFVKWKEQGKTRYKYFGNKPDSRLRAEVFNARITKPRLPTQDILPVFVELVNVYMAARQINTTEVNFSNLQYRMEGKILPHFGNRRVDMITHEYADLYVLSRMKEGVKRSTVSRDLTDVKAVLNWSVKRGLILNNPLNGYRFPENDDAIIQPLAADDLKRIVDNAAEHLQRAMLLAYYCGMRPGAVELLSIRYNQIDWPRMELTVISARKGGTRSRTIPLHPDLPIRSWFEADGEPADGYIITWAGKPVKSILAAFNNAKRRAGIPKTKKIPPYALRHAFVTNLLHNGVDVHTISTLTGHSPKTLLKHYAHASDPVKISAIQSLPNPLENDE